MRPCTKRFTARADRHELIRTWASAPGEVLGENVHHLSRDADGVARGLCLWLSEHEPSLDLRKGLCDGQCAAEEVQPPHP